MDDGRPIRIRPDPDGSGRGECGGGVAEEEEEEVEEEMEDGVRWAVEVGIWAVCFGVGYLISVSTSKRLLNLRRNKFKSAAVLPISPSPPPPPEDDHPTQELEVMSSNEFLLVDSISDGWHLLNPPFSEGWHRDELSSYTYDLLFKICSVAFSMGVRDGRVEISETSPHFTSAAAADCSELRLAVSTGKPFKEVCLSHRSTGQMLNLPPLVNRCVYPRMQLWGVAHVPESMDCKVVQLANTIHTLNKRRTRV
ncbi:mediator of RNA polymerase II transcription subunit [Striga asiatica]|uniref:Mediator of RNA polymerase II transcription subunit n=1 Tax=Striga asiatica TaxID=4170 RepID=A0A5A7P9T8_STRAF|nr:mediator of RNA polymerase II transcription subunit [Striga asiatica]